jgi:plastocyanin
LLTNSANLGPVGNVIITGGTNGYVLQTDGAGNLSWVAQSGGGGSTSNISNGNSNVNIPTANGNINFSAVGNTTMVVTGTGANIAGTLNISGNATVGNLDFGSGEITGTGNITSGNANLGNLATANFFSGNGSELSALTFGNITTFSTAGLTTDQLYLQGTTRLNVTASGASGYLFDQYGATLNPAIYITSGQTLAFNLNVSGHPFLIQTSGGANYSTGLEYVDTTGTVLTASAAQGQIAGTLYWKVPYGITGNYKYQCSVHGGMNGNIVVTDANVANIQVGNSVVSGTVYTNAQPNITSVGTLTSLSVTGNITGGNANLGNLVTANFFSGAGNNLSNIQAANVSGQVSNALISGTVYTNAQPNITSLGTLTDVSVSGNGVFGGNLTVNGTLTYINSTTLSISDPIINLQTGPNGAAPVANTGKDVGTALNYYDTSAKIAWMGWDISNAEIAFGSNVGISSEVVTFTELANIRSGNAILGNLANANYFIGNGSLLTGVTTASISNGNSNVNIPLANGNINFSAEGNANILVVTGTGANITGNLTTTNIITGNGAGGNIINANVISANTFIASGNVTAGNANLGNLAIANFFSGAGNNLSNISAGNVTGQVANALIAGTVYTNAQPNITSVGTLTSLAVSGNVTASILVSNVTTGTAPFTVTSTTQVANLNVATAGTVTTNAQPNITSVGSLTGLTVSNATGVVDFTTTANVTLGAVGNLHISGGTNAYVLSTDGSGTLSWVAQSGGGGGGSNISNGNSNVNIPVANGNINFSAVGNANVMVITGTGANISGTANVTGNLSAGNIIAGNGSGGNITNANVISANTFIASGNISAGNANLGNLVTANFFTGDGSALSALTFGNITTFNTAGLTTDELYLQATTRLNVTASGTSGYLFDQYGATINPAIYVTSGQTLAFNLNVSGHPFLIQTSGGANYSVGLEHVTTTGTVSTTTSAQGQIAGTLYWKIPYGIVGNYKYQCSIHGGMNGNIVVTDANVANITVGLATFATTANAVAGGNVSGQVSNSLISGTVYTNAQPNITSTGSLIGLTVSNATGVVDFTTTANVTLGAVGNLHISGGTNGYVLSTDGSGALSWVAQSGGGSGSNISNGNSNVNIPAANGNINFSAVGNANVVVITGTGANISGTLNVTGQSNLGAVGNVVITGGTNGYVLSTDGSGALSWVAQSGGGGGGSNISNGNSNVNIPSVNGNINFSAVGNANVMTITGTGANISGYANITGNIALSGANVSLGNVSNLHITGGSNTFVLSTDGSGNLTWAAASGTSIGVDNFTGNGVQTAYTLTSTPANANATLVSIAGTFQPRTVYSLTGNVITFSSAPPNTAPIEVTTFTAGNAGGGGITAQDLISPFLLMGA